MPRPLLRAIISGGQTGVDRAALDVALEVPVPCAGWCPAGRRAEDGPIADRYPLRETPSADPAQRTEWNAFDADALLVLGREPLQGGSTLAVEVARRFDRPTLVVDPAAAPAEQVRHWLSTLAVPPLLNIAGPRESEMPGIYASARAFVARLLGDGGQQPDRGPPPFRTALVTGGAGYLGTSIVRLTPPGWDVHSTVRRRGPAVGPSHTVDLSNADSVGVLLDRLRPALVVHTAYSTAEPERDIRDATRNVAREATRVGAHLVHLSTDMVLDGENAPFPETAAPAPVHDYGRWKAEAEELVGRESPSATIVRASLLTGFDPPDPRTAWILAGLRGDERVTLFVDEIRTPILVEDLARQIWEIAGLPPESRAGVWHLAGPEALSRFGLGAIVAAAYGMSADRLRAALSRSLAEPRPRDLRLLTRRADQALLTRARPLSVAAAEFRDRT